MKDLVIDQINNSDSSAFKRLRRGEMPVDVMLDLHGYSLFDARLEFYDFIKSAQSAGQRVALVVTGKGSGALQSGLASWINDPDLQPLILTCCYAPAHMGGNGAVLFLLKKPQ